MWSIKLLVHSESLDRTIYWLVCEDGPKVKQDTYIEESWGPSRRQAGTRELAGWCLEATRAQPKPNPFRCTTFKKTKVFFWLKFDRWSVVVCAYSLFIFSWL